MDKGRFFKVLGYLLAFSLMFVISSWQQLMATHLRAGEIIVERVNCQSLTFRITIIVYSDTGSDVKFGEGFLDFGDGSELIQLPQIDNGTRVILLPNNQVITEAVDLSGLGNEVSSAQYVLEHTYSSPGKYKIGYVEPNRNEGVINLDNSVNTTFYVETEINIDPFLGCNNTPVMLIPPIDRACPGVAFFHNPGAFDPDGDSIAFELVVPKKEFNTVVDGFLPPDHESFYDNFSQGNETADGEPFFQINPISGDLTWNAPGSVPDGGFEEYNIAFIVKEYRNINGEWFLLGFVTRDMQIIVEDCDNERPELIVPDDICVEAGDLIDEIIFGTDPDGHDVKIEAFSQVFDLGAQVSPDDGSFQPSNPPAELRFTWDTECLDVRDQSYQVVFKITDNPDQGPKLVSFKAWNITIVGPKPQVHGVTQVGQTLNVTWDSYVCQNAELLQVWRRVDTNPYVPAECETGIRENAGYELVQELPVTASSYADGNLASAAKYCYRVVAIFPQPSGGESIVSDEVCFEFVPAEEPIITHVSVESTDETDGSIVVGWREPFELDPAVYPHPYIYRIFRAEGFSGSSNEVEIASVTINTPTTDSLGVRDTGLNTLDNIYNYRIELTIPGGPGGGSATPLVSAEASSVRLEPIPQFQRIELQWQAQVPWSNFIATAPGSRHLIYRGLLGDTDDELVLIDEVDVNLNGLVYVDSGQYNNTPLQDDQVYCYRVLTKGTYGNPNINTPLLNFSQMVCAQPSDSIPPCAPVLTIQGNTCEEFLIDRQCNLDNVIYSNTITWSTEFVGDCQDDIREYELYYAPQKGSDFVLLTTTRDTVFVHDSERDPSDNTPKLNTFKGCYRVRAIDRSGNLSEFSDDFCVDNCPSYVLPNIITLNNDQFNETFRPFNGLTTNNKTKEEEWLCVAFVKKINLTIYNRWGGKVYTYSGAFGSENNELINWNGVGDNGNDVSTGVYYYLAEVTFDTVDPEESVQELKGWLHVLR